MSKNFGKYIGYFLAICLLAVLVWVAVKQIKEHNLQEDPMLYVLKEALLPVHPVIEQLSLYKGDKSYTINKQKVFLCLYDENGDYYPLNMLIYVLLHEVAHVLNTKDVGHTPAFHAKMDELLDKATELGIFNPSIPILKNYCNHD